jgi:hypothetical protein
MPTITYKVQTQLISVHREDGTRINSSRKKSWRNWNKHKERLENIRDAIRYAIKARNTMTPSKWGCIVVIRKVVNGRSSLSYQKIYESKFGNDGLPFDDFYSITGDYWRRQLNK